MSKIRIVQIINSFEPGGAETMLCNLVLRMDRSKFDTTVISLIDDMSVAEPILKAGFPLITIGMSPGLPDPRGVGVLAAHLRRLRPHVVQTWMDHSNLIGGLASRMVSPAHVIWGVHHSDHVAGLTKRSTLLTVQACAKLSSFLASQIVFCSEHAQKLYSKRGFAADRMMVIPNGFDTSRFSPEPQARLDIRHELGLKPDATLIGLVARYDPLKDHANFLRAAGELHKSHPEVHFLMCGLKVDKSNPELMSLITSLGLNHRCHLLGSRRDVPRIHAALDIATSSSVSEAFPLVVGEAMACGVPCVATNVGDSALIVGTTGKIVPPSNSPALAQAWKELLLMEPQTRNFLGQSGRRRVRDLFDLDSVTQRYESVYMNALEKPRRKTAAEQFRVKPAAVADFVQAVPA